jgi:hypothetical protein
MATYHETLEDAAMKALEELCSDMSVSAEETASSLQEIKEYINNRLDALKESR